MIWLALTFVLFVVVPVIVARMMASAADNPWQQFPRYDSYLRRPRP